MKVLVIGNGGREHAICWKLSQSPKLTKLYCLPGNPGTAALAESVALNVGDVKAAARWAKENKIDLTIVGPEAPLALGIADAFIAEGLKIFGPVQAAARMESSKSFAKDVMLKAGVATADGVVADDYNEAVAYVRKHGAPIVVKADGLAAGKGVTVAKTVDEAVAALTACMKEDRFGTSGNTVVIEHLLEGREASIMAIIDGDVVKPFVVSQDYKRVGDGDEGPNTGGMGAISPTPVFPDARVNESIETIFKPVLAELKRRGIDYRGFLYAGVMVNPSGKPYIIEFNCRLGDPETQVLLTRMESDLLEILWAAVNGKLAETEMKFKSEAATCIVLASRGYPDKLDDGKVINGLFAEEKERIVFQAGTTGADGKVISKGGRVLGVTALGKNVDEARTKAYAATKQISFEGMHYRKDIGI